MSLRDLCFADWGRMSDEVAKRECEALSRSLPGGLTLTNLVMHEYCGRSHRVARFSTREAGDLVHFVLVPGGEVSLGFDGRDFKPSRRQIKSFQGWPLEMLRRDYEPQHVKFTIHDFVEQNTSSRRTVVVPTVLMEVEARPVEQREDVETIDQRDPIYKQFSLQNPEVGRFECYDRLIEQCSYIIDRSTNGNFSVWRRPPTTVDYVSKQLAKQGMRLPTCDEWEHACGAGARTLFRWGDQTPDDYYPSDTCAEDRELKRAWALSLGKLRYEEPPPGWTLHSQLNLFGLRIAMDPYQWDLVSDEPWRLGGDGGVATCGGHGFFLGWLPLATAFRDYFRGAFAPDEDNVADEYHRVRRVISIP